MGRRDKAAIELSLGETTLQGKKIIEYFAYFFIKWEHLMIKELICYNALCLDSLK